VAQQRDHPQHAEVREDRLHLCGVDLEKLSDLPKHLKKLLDVKLEVTKKTKGDNENIFFNRRSENDRVPGKFRQEAGDALVPF